MAIAINGSGTVTGISVGGLPDGCVDTDTLATSVTRGKILQVVQTIKKDTQSFTTSGYPNTLTAITGLQPVITPTSSSSKILLQWSINVSGGINTHTSNLFYRTISGSEAEITDFKGDAAGSNRVRSAQQVYGGNDSIDVYRQNIFSGFYLDTPNTTLAITYSVKFRVYSTDLYINRSQNDTDADWASRTASTFIAMEIAA